jgi:hypothetical protein
MSQAFSSLQEQGWERAQGSSSLQEAMHSSWRDMHDRTWQDAAASRAEQ